MGPLTNRNIYVNLVMVEKTVENKKSEDLRSVTKVSLLLHRISGIIGT